MELFKASRQWAARPDDERFASLTEMHRQCVEYFDSAAEGVAAWADLRVEAAGPEVALVGRPSAQDTALRNQATLTHYGFGQLCERVGAPASYLRGLPATLAAQNLNHGLAARADDPGTEALVLIHRSNGSMLARAVTSRRYQRIWNHEVTARLLRLEELGWRVPPARPAFEGQRGTRAATEEDVLAGDEWDLSVKVGDPVAPAGLYASDHDMFAFMVDQSRRVDVPAGDGGPAEELSRGFFVENSEVGDSSLRVTRFRYRHVCGNHIVWGATNLQEVAIRHVGDAAAKWGALQADLRRYAEGSASDEVAGVTAARRLALGGSKDEVLDFLFGKRIATYTALEQAYDMAEANCDEDGSPWTAWGMANGLTRLSQRTPYGDARVELDRAAGKVIRLAF